MPDMASGRSRGRASKGVSRAIPMTAADEGNGRQWRPEDHRRRQTHGLPVARGSLFRHRQRPACEVAQHLIAIDDQVGSTRLRACIGGERRKPEAPSGLPLEAQIDVLASCPLVEIIGIHLVFIGWLHELIVTSDDSDILDHSIGIVGTMLVA